MATGIYSIVNMKDGTQYIGQSINFSRRQEKHFALLKKNKHPNKHLQRAFNRDGLNSFQFRILEECTDDCLVAQEQFWYDRCKSFGIPTYNFSAFVDSPMKGRKHSEETKQKYFLGHKASEAARKKLSVRFSGSNNPFYGKKHSDETLAVFRQPKSDYLKALWSSQRKGRKLTEEWKRNIREGCKGINTKTKCPAGHLKTPDNTYSKSTCKPCALAASRRATVKKRELRNGL